MIDLKPPISRAKMMSVTKSAIKAIKFYKHVVQIVEKFIKKCKPELKVSGLYVVDSIVRQSRHQFGVDKDVFGPRFLKNFTETFQNLYSCPEEDKSKIVRVLNLWQKNGVFGMDILQPLMDMSHDAVIPIPELKVPVEPQPEVQPTITSATDFPATQQLATHDALAAVAQLISSPQGQELQRLLQNLQQVDKNLSTIITDNLPTPPQLSAPQFSPHNNPYIENKSSFAEKLLDRFDYDDEPEDIRSHELTSRTQWTSENKINNFNGQMPNTANVFPHMMAPTDGHQVPGATMSHAEHIRIPDGHRFRDDGSNSQRNSREGSTHEGRHRRFGRRTRSRSRSRSPRRRGSRSSSRSRRFRQRRSRSRDRRRRSTSKERNEIQKDKERRLKGLPILKRETLSVCSTTLWVGQLDKKTQQSDVMSLFEEFGQIVSINMIPPRGCAYIGMVHRQDAYTALKRLSRGSYKVHQKPVKVAWALNKGIKAAHKKLWDVDQGVTYIPWSKVKVEELESYREGGILDMETLNPEWNISQDINMQPIVNGELESISGDGMIPTQIQVLGVQLLCDFSLVMHILFRWRPWSKSPQVLFCGGPECNKTQLLIDHESYLKVSSYWLCSINCFKANKRNIGLTFWQNLSCIESELRSI